MACVLGLVLLLWVWFRLVGLLLGWLLCCGFVYAALSCAFIGCGVDVCLFGYWLVRSLIVLL